MGFFDKLDKFLEKAEKYIDDASKTSYSKEELINLCKNDRRILYDPMLLQAQKIDKDTVKFRWSTESEGTCTINELSENIFNVTIKGSVYGENDFGSLTCHYNYTKTIQINNYGELNPKSNGSFVTVTKSH